jgi:hypothetical protein
MTEHMVGICDVSSERTGLGKATYDLTLEDATPDAVPPTGRVHGRLTPRGWDARIALKQPVTLAFRDGDPRRFEVTSSGWNKVTKSALVAGSQLP